MKKLISPSFKTWRLLALLAFAWACAAPSVVVKIHTSQNQQANFGHYRTYGWLLPPQATPTREQNPTYMVLDAHLRKAISQEIEKKGLLPASGEAQVLLAYDVSLPRAARPAAASQPGSGSGLASRLGYHYDYTHTSIPGLRPVEAFNPGTILIDIIDAQTRELIWRGWAEEVLDNFNADFKTIEKYVDDILDKYPAPAP